MKRSTPLALLAFVLPLTLVTGAGPPAGKTDTTRADVQAFVKAYAEAANKADVSAFMEMYSRKPGVTSISDGEIARGWEAIRADADLVVGKEGSYKFSIGSIDVTRLGSTHALAVAPYTLSVTTEKGTVQLESAMTMVLERSGSTWTIVHDHMSTKAEEYAGQGD